MLSAEAKALFAKLEMDYPPVAIKFSFGKPQGLPRVQSPDAFCQFVKKIQTGADGFYTTAADDTCFGRMVLGMIDKPPFAASGQAGIDFGVFKTQAPNARLYTQISTLTRGSVNYVSFVPLSTCTFDPDLVICVTDTRQAGILLRASSYYSGDLWESKSSPVLSCAWMYSYPYVNDKVNTLVTGMGHGMTRRHTYPAGMQVISIPYGKLGSIVQALGEMDWELLALSEDPQDKEELAKRMGHWDDIQASAIDDMSPATASALMPGQAE